MRAVFLSSLLLAGTVVSAFDNRFILDRTRRKPKAEQNPARPTLPKRNVLASQFNNANTTKFAVNGTAIPDVDFDAGESYAGQLPVGNGTDGQMYFWFWPTTNPDQPKEILLWLNGGPGCSSLEGFLQENGPISWPIGTYKPVQNEWAWNHITNVVWVEQPIGTGFSQGTVTARSEDDVAQQFMGFWKNFIDTFGMHGYKVYITGESYAGMYCPYIASHMLDTNDTTYYNVKGMHIIDPSIVDYTVGTYIPTNYFVNYFSNVFPLNSTTLARLQNSSKTCGYDDYMNKYLTFPPPGPQPRDINLPGLNATSHRMLPGCRTTGIVEDAIYYINPGFNIYQVTQMIPVPDDVLGFPYSDLYVAPGRQIYFNRPEVKRAINAPLNVNWSICTDNSVFVHDEDLSDASSVTVLAGVIDRTQNVLISHGVNDMVLIANGTLLAIQNMTWGGKLGFQEMPKSPLFVPHHPNPSVASASGQGVLGTTHTERGLTWSLITLSGHMTPTWQPALNYRQIEFMLGRVDSLSSVKPMSAYPNATQPSADSLGSAVGPTLGRVAGADGGNNASQNGTAGQTGAATRITGAQGSLASLVSVLFVVVVTVTLGII